MKVLLINPPLGIFNSIYTSIPLLKGQLVGNNIDTDILDFNVEFLREITSPRYLKETKKYLKKIYKNPSILNKDVSQEYHLSEAQILHQRKIIEKYLISNTKLIDIFMNKKESFFDQFLKATFDNTLKDSNKYDKYVKIFHSLVYFSFLPYYPEENYTKLCNGNPVCTVKNPLYNYTYKDITDKCSNRKRNIYINFFEKKVKELNLKKYDVIGITIPFEQNLYPALTLSKILKEKTKAKIIIGGIVPTTTIDSFISHPDMFGKYFDYILSGDGETSIVEYIKSFKNQLPISEVSGLVYKTDDVVKRNDIKPIKNINEIHPPNYDGINFNNYTNKNDISLEFSKGCYWHKCTYCYNNLWKKYYVRTPEKAVDIIQLLNQKYDTKFFNIFDDALNINFAEKFADELIKRNLNIKYTCFLRVEEELDYELLKKLKESGLKGIFIGIESGSERILQLMNKGINLNTAERILKDCHKIGIETHIGLMYRFPTETKEDTMKTIDFLNKTKKYITNQCDTIFHLTKSSAMLTEENIEKFQLTNITQPEEFSDDVKYDAPGISKDEVCKILEEHKIKYVFHTKWF